MSFKDTLVGQIPSDWSIFSVGELVNEGVLFKPLDGNHGGIHPKGSDFVTTGIPFIMASDINNGSLSFNECKFITELQANQLRKGFAIEGDVLITHKATIGRVALVKKNPYKFIMLTPQVTYYRVANKKKLDNKFLKFYFEYHNFKNLLYLWSGAGSTRSYIGITEQLKLPVVVPPIEEQWSISNILYSLDEKIELNNAINKNLEEMAQALFKRWFVDFEFPNENGEPYKTSGGEFEESELGLIPKGWRVGLLSELGEVVGGATPSKNKEEYYTTQGIPWITPKDLSINKNKYISRGQIDITEDGFKNSSTKLVPKGTILFSSRAPIGYIAISKNEMTTNQGFKSLIPFKHIGTEFLYYVLKFNTEMIESRASGSTFKEISGSEMKRIPVLIPISRVIEQFNEVVEPLGKLVEKCESENDSLILLRDSLLPKLMSGEIRVPLEQEYVGTASLPMAAENKAQYSTT